MRQQNKMFGIASADKTYGQSMELGKKVLKGKPQKEEEVENCFASQV